MFALVLACTPAEPPADGAPTLDVSGSHVAYDAPGHGSAKLDATVFGEGTFAITLRLENGNIHPRVTAETDGTLRGAALTGSYEIAGKADAVIWRQGYQSWSWSGVTTLTTPALDGDGLPTVAGDGDIVTISQETPWSSWWVGMVGRPQGSTFLMGAVSAKSMKFWTAFTDTEAWAVWGMRGESVAMLAGETRELDAIWLSVGDSRIHESYGDRVNGRIAQPPPVGWSDWYQYYGEATEVDIRANLTAAAALSSALTPLQVFQVDDGWALGWGEWSTNADFPSGTAGLARDIAAAGYTPGLWMAPFYVSRDTATYLAHPDWWVRGPAGDELRYGSLDGNDYAILDVTVADAALWLHDEVQAKKTEGWDYLKLDFLFSGAVEGVRSQPVTGMEAYAIGMELLRDAVGDGWLLACGAPMLPTVGYADSWRSGNDIAYISDPDPQLAYLRWEARNTAARAFANGRWWWNDPDAVLVRGWDDRQTSGAVATAIVTGGSWFVGDAFSELAESQLTTILDPELTALRGQRFVPVNALNAVSGFDAGPFVEKSTPDDNVPVEWLAQDGTHVYVNVSDLPVQIPPSGDDLLLGDGDDVLAAGEGEVRR